jgi:ribosomal protein S4E
VIPSNAGNVNLKDVREEWKKYKHRRIRSKTKLKETRSQNIVTSSFKKKGLFGYYSSR